MYLHELPLNEAIQFGGYEHTAVFLTRVEEEKVIIQYVNKASGDEVARLTIQEQADPELTSMDYAYWSCSINGIPATGVDLSDLQERNPRRISINPGERTVEFFL